MVVVVGGVPSCAVTTNGTDMAQSLSPCIHLPTELINFTGFEKLSSVDQRKFVLCHAAALGTQHLSEHS